MVVVEMLRLLMAEVELESTYQQPRVVSNG
jgi:hypothetical protein